jgi:hypothetical protein
MEEGNWNVPKVGRQPSFDLHPDIRNAFNELRTIDQFVTRLALLCKPNTVFLKECADGSKQAFYLLRDYWAILQDVSLSKEERKKKSLEQLELIEQDMGVVFFYNQFTQCLKKGQCMNPG